MPAVYDVKQWLEEIKAKGIGTTFTFEDLKRYGLDKQEFVNKAKSNGLIRKTTKKKTLVQLKDAKKPLTVWEIVEQ